MKFLKRVKKVWGREIWIANNKLYCGKLLSLKKGYHSSYHRHLVKDETFFVLKGRVLLQLGHKFLTLKRNDSIRIKPKHWHRFYGIVSSTIIEFSTRHSDRDVERKTQSGKGPIK